MEKQKKDTNKKKTTVEKEEKVLNKKKQDKTTKSEVNNKKSKEVVKIEEKKSIVDKEVAKKTVNNDTKKESKGKKEKKPGVFKTIINFFKGVKSEMSKVSWPSKKNMIKYSVASIIFILFFALYFYGIEVLMAWLKSIIVVI